MELIFPIAVYIGIAVVLVLLVLRFKNKDKFNKGIRVAKASFIEETEIYKKLFKQYKIFKFIALLMLLVAIMFCFMLISRPSKVEKVTHVLHNRDIFLCLDVSGSMTDVNLEICTKLIDLVEKLEGERFGISIFNSSTVTLVPLTNDYDYVLQCLEKLKKSFELSNSEDGRFDDLYSLGYSFQGTTEGEGGSLIGDGLATCLYSFPDLETNKDRTRIILLATDNDIAGTQIVTLDEAASLCLNNDVKVYGISPDLITKEEEFKKAINKTGGEYYNTENSNAINELVAEIEKTLTSEIEKVELRVYEQPKVFFICIVVFTGGYLILRRKARI